MSFPDKCPNCGEGPSANQWRTDRRFYSCGSFVVNSQGGPLSHQTGVCGKQRIINKAATVIRAFLDGDRDAREKGFNWIAENTP